MKWQIVAIGMLAVGSVSANGAPFLEGKVTDEQGRPITGATVKIWDCIPTCLGGKAVLTDQAGHYVFEEKPFRAFPSLVASLPGRYEVSRDEAGPKLHDEATDVPRRVDFVLGTPAEAAVYLKGEVPAGWKQEVSLRSGRDVRLHRYDVDGRHVSGWDYWDFESLPRNEALHLVVAREPIPAATDPEEARKEETWRRRIEIISPGFRLPQTQRYDIRAHVERDSAGDSSYIVIDSIRDAVAQDRTQELVDPGSAFGPPVDEAKRAEALALLERVKKAAAPWNALPPKTVASYEYDANLKGEATHVSRDKDSPAGPAWSDISRVRGFAYMPPLRWLFSQPDNVLFHGVDIGEDRAVLTYRLKEPRGFTAGLGVGPSWNGFFSSSFGAGTIVIDPKTATVLEHRLSKNALDRESVETFGDYVSVGDGYAPTSLRIESEEMDFRLTFRVHEGQLWLLDEAKHGDDSDPTLKIENVVVNLAE